MDITINDVKEWIEAHEHPDITTYSHEALKFLLSEVERLEIDNISHGYSLNILRKDCGLDAGESYQEVDAYILKLQEDNTTLTAVVDRLEKENAALREVVEAAKSVEAQFGGQLDQFGNAALDALDLALNNAKDILEANNE